jgi:hypothetical protein
MHGWTWEGYEDSSCIESKAIDSVAELGWKT